MCVQISIPYVDLTLTNVSNFRTIGAHLGSLESQMADRPGAGSTEPPRVGIEFNWRPIQAGTVTDTTTPVGDRPITPGTPGVLELSYTDPNFDRKLAAGNYQTLKIKDFPQTGVSVSSWVDNNGYFMWFKGGADNRAPHYLPPGLKTIEVNGYTQNVDEMRIQASLSAIKEQDKTGQGFSAVNGRTSPLEFAQRMGNLGAEHLLLQEKTLRQAADASPTNPYFRLYLSDVLLAEAFKPIMDQLKSGQDRIDLNTPYTQQKMNEAIVEARKAQVIAQQQGGVRYPNTTSMPGLFPFGLNPYQRNPDMYWGGALYQGYQREAGLRLLQAYVQRFSSVELPPALPPKDVRSP